MRSGIILAGGKSTRINTNKSMAQIGNKKMIEHVRDNLSGIVDEVLVVAGDIGQRDKISTVICGVSLTRDSIVGYGPVAGILAGLQSAKGDLRPLLSLSTRPVSAYHSPAPRKGRTAKPLYTKPSRRPQ